MTTIRQAKPEEIPQLKDLWKKSFGDPSVYIETFFNEYCTADQVLVVENDGEIDSMAAMLPSTLELSDGLRIPVGYVYALATNPYVQGRGHARQLLAYADQYLKEQGMKAMALVPASPALHRLFAATGMLECFGTRKVELLNSNLTGNTEGTEIQIIDTAEYNEIRESHLMSTFHMMYTDHRLGLQKLCCQISNGNLYKVIVDGEVGCAAVEFGQKRRVLVKELIISPDKMARAVEAIAKAVDDASGYHVRTPAFWEGLPGSYLQEFGMIKWYDQSLKNKWFSRLDAYLGLAFD